MNKHLLIISLSLLGSFSLYPLSEESAKNKVDRAANGIKTGISVAANVFDKASEIAEENKGFFLDMSSLEAAQYVACFAALTGMYEGITSKTILPFSQLPSPVGALSIAAVYTLLNEWRKECGSTRLNARLTLSGAYLAFEAAKIFTRGMRNIWRGESFFDKAEEIVLENASSVKNAAKKLYDKSGNIIEEAKEVGGQIYDQAGNLIEETKGAAHKAYNSAKNGLKQGVAHIKDKYDDYQRPNEPNSTKNNSTYSQPNTVPNTTVAIGKDNLNK